ncbi:MAG TPA: menaquinone biosynthesis decarboxylase, partial [Deinococcales bacterium]|nr:menaquinone biosynthesis decarboxylase [Deinococcales bacterium]
MARDLRDFLNLLEQRGQLRRVAAPVSRNLELTEIADRLVKAGGPAVLFENVEGSPFPVAMNLMGTSERMAWALGEDNLDAVAGRVRGLLGLAKPGNLLALAGQLGQARGLLNARPARVRRGVPVQQVVWTGDSVNLDLIPVLKCWPEDGGPFVTLPLVVTRDPETGEPNLGMYRMQVYDRRTTGMHWQRHKTGARHLAKARARGERLPVAVALGGPPALIYAATAPIPPVPGVNEYALAGFLNRSPVRLTRGLTVPLDVPADAEFVLEGYVDPGEPPRLEGPFGDHTGFYTLPDDYPVFHVTTVTMRRDAIYPATIVGRPPMEDAFLIEASERLFLEPARMILPELVDYAMPPVGVAHNLVNASLTKDYPGQAYKVANGLLGLGQMMFAKVLVMVDAGAPVKDTLATLAQALRHALPGRDTAFTRGPMDVLDHSSRGWAFGSKLILD